jgi:antitoxin ParD1/3/4
MPTRNISLTAMQDAFIYRLVRNGTYQNASEAVRDALRLLRQRRLEEAARLKELRRHVRNSLDEFERGDFAEVDGDELETFFAGPRLEPGPSRD